MIAPKRGVMEIKGSKVTWKPSHEPVRYDRARVARLKPLQDAVARLGLPPLVEQEGKQVTGEYHWSSNA